MFIVRSITTDGVTEYYVDEQGAPAGAHVCEVIACPHAEEQAQAIADALNARYSTTDELVQIIRFWFVRVFGRTRELKTPHFDAMVERTEKLLAAYPPRPIRQFNSPFNPRG